MHHPDLHHPPPDPHQGWCYPRQPRPAAEAWTAENTDGVTVRPVGTSSPNPAGFYDLLGNVEEWAAASAGDTRAPVVGGSIVGPQAKELPVRPTYLREKTRVLGFRIVIE